MRLGPGSSALVNFAAAAVGSIVIIAASVGVVLAAGGSAPTAGLVSGLALLLWYGVLVWLLLRRRV